MKLFNFLGFIHLIFAKPIARNLVYHVSPGEEVVVELLGYDMTGEKLSATITSLPDSGTLHQLSQVYNTHGYDPKANVDAILIAPVIVSGSKNRVVYKRPKIDVYPSNGKYAEFKYYVTGSSGSSSQGLVTISYSDVTMSSDFDESSEGWKLYMNGNGKKPIYQQISQGLISYYIHGTEELIQLNSNGYDAKLWYFDAPSLYYGNHWDKYNGLLEFVLLAHMGDFATTNINNDGTPELIVLECARCALNRGIRLVRRLDENLSFNGDAKSFSILLNEKSGWLKDTGTIVEYSAPTQCEFVQVLSDLSAVRILGDFTKGYETVALDKVKMKHGDGQPIACYE